MKEQKLYTTIPVEKQEATSLKESEKGSALSGLVGKDGMIDALIDNESVDEILSTSIYTRPEIALREAFNNSLRQCRTAEKDYGANPRIDITIDVKKRRLIIFEQDSMGMPVKIFAEVYRYTGRSGNFDGTESGQFGIGKKSYRAIADTMIFETYARETNERYSFITKGAKFEELPPPKFEQYGTRVSFAIKTDIKLTDLAKYIQTIARFTKIKTFLEFTDNLYEHEDPKYRKHGAIFDKGITKIGPVDEKKYLCEQMKLDGTEPWVQWIEMDKTDYYLLGAYSYSSADDTHEYNTLVGIPIGLGEHDNDYGSTKPNKIPDPGFMGYILHIKDERKYPPTASRDFLKEESFNKISTVIRKDLEEFFSEIDIQTFEDYSRSDKKYYVENLPGDGFSDAMPRSTLNIHNLFKIHNDLLHLKDKEITPMEWSIKLEHLASDNTPVVYNYNKTKSRISAVLKHAPETVVIIPTGNKHDRHNSIILLENAGIQSITDYLKENKIKAPRDTIIKDVAVRFLGYGDEVTQMDIDELSPNCIRIPKEELEGTSIREYCYNLRGSEFSSFGMFRDQRKFEDTASITLEEFITNTRKETFQTSKGEMTGAAILKHACATILRAHESKFPEKMTFDFCLKNTKPKLVIHDEGEQKVQALMLASKIQGCTEFDIVGSSLDHIIIEDMVRTLKIKCEGKWKENPDDALKYLGEIKNQMVREMYAVVYSKVFEYSKGWESEEKDDIETYTKLHQIFRNLDSTTAKNKMELATEILDEQIPYNKDYEYDSWQKKAREIAKEELVAGIKKIPDKIERFTTAIRLALKGKVAEDNITVQTKKEEYSIRDNIIVNIKTNDKITLNDKLFRIIHKVSDNYGNIDSVTIDGENIQVVLD